MYWYDYYGIAPAITAPGDHQAGALYVDVNGENYEGELRKINFREKMNYLPARFLYIFDPQTPYHLCGKH